MDFFPAFNCQVINEDLLVIISNMFFNKRVRSYRKSNFLYDKRICNACDNFRSKNTFGQASFPM